jgi:hypothetical protein
MSPEQAQGEPVDVRSDLFSLGSVLYAMCTGRSPFRAETTVASLRRVCDDSPRPIREINPDIPEWLVAIVDRLLEKDPDDRFQAADEVSDLLSRHLAHLQNPQLAALPDPVKPAKSKPPRRAAGRRRWAVAAAILLAAFGLATVSDATGVTNIAATVIRIATGEGTLVIEVDDPAVQVSIDGEEVSITGAGIKELTLRPGQYQIRATKDGEPVKQELVNVTRGDRQVVRVTREPVGKVPSSQGVTERASYPGAFVVLGTEDVAMGKYDTLAEAVLNSSHGDTIEIRGNGPFVTDPIQILHPVSMRAAAGFRPVIRMSSRGVKTRTPLLKTDADLVLEGIEFQRSGPPLAGVPGQFQLAPCLIWGEGAVLRVANCRFQVSPGMLQVCVYSERNEATVFVCNCMFLCPDSLAVSAGIKIQRRVMANCVQIGGKANGVHRHKAESARAEDVLMTQNTLIATLAITGFLTGNLADGEVTSATRTVRIEASHNIFDAPGALTAHGHTREMGFAALGNSAVRQLIAWQDRNNLYRPGGCSLFGHAPESSEPLPNNPAEWADFWNEPEAVIKEGVIRYQGGDLVSKLFDSPDEITPDDFRLRSDSAGYRVRSDGKDLGANIDFVGPGEGYERWKETPDYQQWQEERRKLMQPDSTEPEPADESGDSPPHAELEAQPAND